ncbi:DUF1720 domain-containing protein [Sedimentibacter hydroxybenzoicus DSM 7310]|uniref:DUF1720 domain-containing protein n=1 Tax=Sedimentibacter hydroxybenzoicus DSM 7310 TaxID=1123245 RepID=A0A974BJ97_SEDHY|nr:DUF1720 domain-containing protein [Sedimentibacter hydroxybenzoicus]NYB73886.1 DUF1720 domain-containing protein [Sedimentibacter hydroxybenzoicus DSM 7310]
MIKGYKGFDKDLKCRGFKYEVGKEYEQEGNIKACSKGFHFCEDPLNVFEYYPPSDSRYCEVEGDGDVDRDGRDSKVAVSKIRVGVEIGLKGIIEAGVKFILDRVDWKKENSTTGDRAGAQATGYQAGAQATGDQAGAQATGYQAGAQATGYQAGAQATGDRAGAQATGYQAGAQATGYQAGAQATGDRAGAQATGYRAGAQAEGDWAVATAIGDCGSAEIKEGKKLAEGCAIALGRKGKAKGAKGCWLTLAEWEQDEHGKWHRVNVQTKRIDGKKIKENTFYMLKNNKFVACDEQ